MMAGPETSMWLSGGLPAIYLSAFLLENLALAVGFVYYLVVMLPIWWTTIYDKPE
jgi:hypothetical protein